MITEPAKRVAFISSYPPRKCGIATFTSDLVANIELASEGEFEPMVVAMGSGAELEYGEPVELKIRKDVKYDYIRTADYINFSDVDVVSVQHEFGLFGGEGGSNLNLLLERLNKPVITTLHIVLEKPSMEYFYSLNGCMRGIGQGHRYEQARHQDAAEYLRCAEASQGTATFDTDTFEAECRITRLDESRSQSGANISSDIDFRGSLEEAGLRVYVADCVITNGIYW